MLLVIVGIALIAVGVALGIYHRGDEAAGVQFFKINISGASWLIIVAMGLAAIFGHWWFDTEHVNQKDPPSEVPLSVVEEAVFDESAPDEPYTFGDDGDLDQLWLGCEAGQMQACDDLYQQSPVDSEYEFFGGTCGLIFEADTAPEFCVEAPIEDTSTDLTSGDFEVESSSADFLSSG
jgi:hypothetical protein